MLDVKLSTLSVVLGLIVALPSLVGIFAPKAFADAVRKFPRHTALGYVLMLLATVWFLYFVSLESVSDFASLKKIFFIVFGGVGIGVCFFVRDFLPVRGLAVIFLLAAKLMVDTARLVDTEWRLVIAVWAYALVLAGMWFTVSPWRLRDILNWSVATESRTRITSAIRVAFGVFVVILGLTVFEGVESPANAQVSIPARPLPSA